MNFVTGSTMDIGVMLGVAFGLRVRELELQVFSSQVYRFPTSLYNCGGTLETSKLGHCVLLDVPFPVCLKSLRTLCLNGVRYQDEGSLVNLLSGCSVLENLVVMRYSLSDSDVETFAIVVPSLLSLTLITNNEEYEYFSAYVIKAPSLLCLNLQGLIEYDACLIENTPELVETNIYEVCGEIYVNIHASLTSVKHLSLKISSPVDLSKLNTNRIFNQLVYLELHTYGLEWWNLLMLILDSSPNMQVLKLISRWFQKGDMGLSQPKHVPECLLNRLETLVWEDYEGEIEGEREVAQYILRNAIRLETATFSKTDIHPEKRLERLKELESVVRASNSCQLVFK